MDVVMNARVEIDGEEVWFHREMNLPFLPIVDMEFEIELVGQTKDMKHQRNAAFVVTEVIWVERKGKIEILLEVHEDEEEEIGRADLNPMVWKEGYKDQWLW